MEDTKKVKKINHFIERMQQRGITEENIEIVSLFGSKVGDKVILNLKTITKILKQINLIEKEIKQTNYDEFLGIQLDNYLHNFYPNNITQGIYNLIIKITLLEKSSKLYNLYFNDNYYFFIDDIVNSKNLNKDKKTNVIINIKKILHKKIIDYKIPEDGIKNICSGLNTFIKNYDKYNSNELYDFFSKNCCNFAINYNEINLINKNLLKEVEKEIDIIKNFGFMYTNIQNGKLESLLILKKDTIKSILHILELNNEIFYNYSYDDFLNNITLLCEKDDNFIENLKELEKHLLKLKNYNTKENKENLNLKQIEKDLQVLGIFNKGVLNQSKTNQYINIINDIKDLVKEKSKIDNKKEAKNISLTDKDIKDDFNLKTSIISINYNNRLLLSYSKNINTYDKYKFLNHEILYDNPEDKNILLNTKTIDKIFKKISLLEKEKEIISFKKILVLILNNYSTGNLLKEVEHLKKVFTSLLKRKNHYFYTYNNSDEEINIIHKFSLLSHDNNLIISKIKSFIKVIEFIKNNF